mmetsp:Transcript_15908/g.22252  ORF Transcript_15908/g.22252 Transcript_15908/m.22252 type:complete len:145 (+) Transcript_15908:215-649(+)
MPHFREDNEGRDKKPPLNADDSARSPGVQGEGLPSVSVRVLRGGVLAIIDSKSRLRCFEGLVVGKPFERCGDGASTFFFRLAPLFCKTSAASTAARRRASRGSRFTGLAGPDATSTSTAVGFTESRGVTHVGLPDSAIADRPGS